MKNRKLWITFLLLICMLAVAACGKKDKEEEEGEATEEVVSDNTTTTNGSGPMIETDMSLNQTTDPSILSLANTYCDCLVNGDVDTYTRIMDQVSEEDKIRLQKKSEYIEYINNRMVYDQPGPSAGIYIVYVYYEVKFTGVETRAPGLVTIYACTREDGTLYISNSDYWDEETTNYVVNAISGNQQIGDFFDRVKVAYADATGSDVALASFMNNLNTILDDAVAAAQAEAAAPDPADTAQETSTNETVTTTDTVNVRASDSETAEKLGKVDAGTKLTRYATLDNGWSKIDYNGKEAYIKSEFLKAEAAAPADNGGDAGNTDNGGEAANTNTDNGGGNDRGKSVTAKESVRVRAKASTDSDVVGQLDAGASCKLLEQQSDGWCKVEYKGTIGYVKTEFVSVSQ